MKAVLISIRPEWCDLIARGEKTLEVRKTKPKIDTPFKCYIYCTKAPKGWFWFDSPNVRRDGAVIGEFICDTFVIDKTFGHDPFFNGAACMSEVQAACYMTDSQGYGWHISDLKIYEKPKELRDFYTLKKCNSCRKSGYESTACIFDKDCIVPAVLTRPPQSWCYVEEVRWE